MKTRNLTKEDRFEAVATSVLKVLADGGVRRVTISRVARLSKISRPWIYANLGSDVKEIIRFAAEIIGKRFTRLDARWVATTTAEAIQESREAAFRMLANSDRYPWLTLIYFQNLGNPGPIGQVIQEIETAAIKNTGEALVQCFGVPKEAAEIEAIKYIKDRLAMAHAWVHDPRVRKLGAEAVAETMLYTP